MQVNGAKIYFTIPVLGGIPITQTAVSSFVVMLLLCTLGYFLGRNLKKRPGRMQVLTEAGVKILYDMVSDTMGPHNVHWAPYIGTLMLTSLFGSLIGMTGIFRSTTSDVSTTLTWALMTSVLVWAGNIRSNGWGSFLSNYINPMNIVSDIAQPVSMAFRHFGNIMGGGVLMSLVYMALSGLSAMVLNLVGSSVIVSVAVLALGAFLLIRAIRAGKLMGKIFGIVFIVTGVLAILESFEILTGVPYLTVGIPGILSMYFDLFSAGVQALVFSLLTMVYVGMAFPPAEEKAA